MHFNVGHVCAMQILAPLRIWVTKTLEFETLQVAMEHSLVSLQKYVLPKTICYIIYCSISIYFICAAVGKKYLEAPAWVFSKKIPQSTFFTCQLNTIKPLKKKGYKLFSLQGPNVSRNNHSGARIWVDDFPSTPGVDFGCPKPNVACDVPTKLAWHFAAVFRGVAWHSSFSPGCLGNDFSNDTARFIGKSMNSCG